MGVHFKRQIAVSFIIVFVVALVSVGVFYYLAGSINTLAVEIAKDKAMSDQKSGALAIAGMLKSQAPQAAVYQAAMDKLHLGQDSLIGFGQWVAGIAGRHQVVASVAFPGNGNSGAGLGQMGFSLAANGGLNDLISFLDDIEVKSPGFLIQMGPFTLTESNGSYELNAQGRVFFRQ